MAAATRVGVHDVCDAMSALSVNEVRLKNLGLDDHVLAKLSDIEANFESIFSWDIKRRTRISQNSMMKMVDKIREKRDLLGILDNAEDNAFNLSRFYLQLIMSYELYIDGRYEESLLEIKSVFSFMETCKFDESNEQYLDACYHVVRATNAYIALTLNLSSNEIMKDVKSVKRFNQVEQAAICAIKALVFMEYPPKGNDIGLELADLARKLDSTEPEWIIIWLKAKGRVRRFYDQFKMPDKLEMDAANILSATKTGARPLIRAAEVYAEVAHNYKLCNSLEESNHFYKISSNLIYNAIALTKDNVKVLKSCLMLCLRHPIKYQLKEILDDIIKVLTSIKNNSCINSITGKYYLIHKEYQKAKIYLSRAMASGHFSSSLQLIKVECLLQPINEYPLINSLNLLYEVFQSPKRRLIILAQILLYYYYYEDNPKELMKYVKIYLEQDIETTIKKHHLITAYPLFQINQTIKPNQFLTSLFSEVKYLKSHHKWTSEEKIIIDQTLIDFNDIMNAKTYENQIHNTNTIGVQKQSYNNDSQKRYLKKNSSLNSNSVGDELSWRRKPVSSNKNDGQQLPSTFKNVKPS